MSDKKVSSLSLLKGCIDTNKLITAFQNGAIDKDSIADEGVYDHLFHLLEVLDPAVVCEIKGHDFDPWHGCNWEYLPDEDFCLRCRGTFPKTFGRYV